MAKDKVDTYEDVIAKNDEDTSRKFMKEQRVKIDAKRAEIKKLEDECKELCKEQDAVSRALDTVLNTPEARGKETARDF